MAARSNKKAGGTPTTRSTGTPAPAKAKPSPATPKSSSSPPAKSAAALGSRPRRGSEGNSKPSAASAETLAGIDQQKLQEKMMSVLGPSQKRFYKVTSFIFSALKMEPAPGFEPETDGLQNR